jgi:hypothetical protein
MDTKTTARNAAQIDDALESASREVDGLCNRVFYPTTRTQTWDYPLADRSRPWRLWLNDDELISVSSLVTGAVTVAASDILLRPDHGPPFNSIEIRRSTIGAYQSSTDLQRAITAVGVFGYDLVEAAAGTLASSCTSGATTVTVSDSSVIGPGSLLRVGTERVVCTEASMVATAATVAAPGLTATAGNVTVPLSGAGPVVGEVILVDSERMLAVDLVGTNLTVRRAWDGSVLAAHSAGAVINALRQLTVTRGALGTSAAAHSSADVVVRHVFPGGIVNLTVALAVVELGSESTGYTIDRRSEQSPQLAATNALSQLIDRVTTQYGRKNRMRAV